MTPDQATKHMRAMFFSPETFALRASLGESGAKDAAFEAMYEHASRLEAELREARRTWWDRINPVRIRRIEGLRLTIVQWCDASVTASPIFKGRYHYADWLLQNHGRFAGWPVGFQVWR